MTPAGQLDNRSLRRILLATSLAPPPVRSQTIVRDRLMERLRNGSGSRLSLLACPAGFGKTALLAAWREAEAAHKPVAWLTVDEGDNDPVVLWSYVIEALRRVCPDVGQSVSAALDCAQPNVDVALRRLVNELAERGEVTLILDDFHRLSGAAASDSIAWFVDHLPPTVQLVLSTRSEPAFGLAALRAHSELLELRADELCFTSGEADAFLNGRLALGLAPEDVDVLVERTEGWPAGLSLAARWLGGTADRQHLVSGFGVSCRLVTDFLVPEVLEAHDRPMQALMLRSSILGRLSGPVCDAVLEQEGSAAMLDTLSRTNLFLIPVDDQGGLYRFKHLFALLLRMELERREPGLAQELHRRAYAWYRDHGMTDEAIHHAFEAGAYAEAAELIEASWANYANAARHDDVLAWLRRFPGEILNSTVHLLLIEAWVLSLSAKREEAARAIAAVERLGGLGSGPLPDGFSSAEASLTMLRAVFPWGDVGAQLDNARRAAQLEAPGSPWRPLACWAVGVGLYFRDEHGEAGEWFAESARLAPASGQWPADTSSLAYRSLIAGERGRLEEQRLLAEQAMELAQERGAEMADGTVLVAAGVSLAAHGRPQEAQPLIERGIAVKLRPRGEPTQVANAMLHHAAVLGALGAAERSKAVIAEARSIIESCPDPGNLTGRFAALGSRPQVPAGNRDPELTARELVVLKLLASDLSEAEIGRELFVTHNTVHGHVRSIYRKLGVSSRGGALERARELGLLH
jgi:LuxR family transcriptional regulator, maltose regulon positive regulatory protein